MSDDSGVGVEVSRLTVVAWLSRTGRRLVAIGPLLGTQARTRRAAAAMPRRAHGPTRRDTRTGTGRLGDQGASGDTSDAPSATTSAIPTPPTDPSASDAEVASLGEVVATTAPSSFRLAERRGRIIDRLLLLLGVVVTAVMVLVGLERVTVDEAVQFFSTVGGPIVTLLGAAVGRYFDVPPENGR